MPECGCNMGGMCDCYEKDGILYRRDDTPVNTFMNRCIIAERKLEKLGDFALKLEKDSEQAKRDAKYATSKWQTERDYSLSREYKIIASRLKIILGIK